MGVHGNLFVVSRLGQVRNAQTFIRDFSATGNYLAVLYTNANMVLTSNIEKNIDSSFFDDVILIKQPDRPTVQTRATNHIVYGQIEDLLVKMSEKGVGNLHLCNVDNYYSLFERVIEDRGLSFTLDLLEEGLGTYGIAGNRDYARDMVAEWSDVRHRAQSLAKATGRALKALGVLGATVFSWIFKTDAFELWRNLSTRLLIDKKHRYGVITHFDTAHVYFPEKVHLTGIQIDRVEQLPFSLEPTASPEALATVDDDAVVFLSQKYIQPEEYFGIVFDILSEMGVRRVYFKFHPRENRAKFVDAWENALHRHPTLNVIVADEIQSIPAEELMMAGKVKQLIGLTSTSLMYGSAFFEGIEVVSIGKRFRQLAESEAYDVSKRVLAEFSRDLDLFLDVSDVRQF